MRVMVTGGAGYIGSVVTEALRADGHTVLVLDDLRCGHRDAVAPEVSFVEIDLAEEPRVRAALAEHAIEAVVHMAADSIVGESMRDPLKFYQNNVSAGVSLLNAMRAEGVSRMVFSSTASVYGAPTRVPLEESDPTTPNNPYGETKLALERAIEWCAVYGLRAVSLRYFNAAGASARCGERHAPETHLIPIVLEVAAGARGAVEVYGTDYPTRDGTCVRDYIHVEDLARAHVLALRGLDRGRVGAFNLGCGADGYTVREVIAAAESVTGRKVAVREGPRREGDPAVLVASSTRIERALGWRPTRTLREMISSAWAFSTRSG